MSVRVPLTSPLAALVAPQFPTIYCDEAAPDNPYHLIPYTEYAMILWTLPPDFVRIAHLAR